MKRVWRSIWFQFRDVFCSKAFWAATSLVCILFLLTDINYYENGNECRTILELWLMKGTDWISVHIDTSWQEVFLNQPQSSITGYGIFIVSIPYVMSHYREKKSGMLRAKCFREGKVSFCLSRVLVGALSGGCCMLLGAALFMIIVRQIFPGVEQLAANGTFWDAEHLEAYNSILVMLEQMKNMFLYGMMMSVFCILLSTSTNDIFICLMLPFVLNWMSYILQAYLTSLVDIEYPDARGVGWNIIRWFRQYTTLSDAIWSPAGQGTFVVLGAVLISLLVHWWQMRRKVDFGA